MPWVAMLSNTRPIMPSGAKLMIHLTIWDISDRSSHKYKRVAIRGIGYDLMVELFGDMVLEVENLERV